MPHSVGDSVSSVRRPMSLAGPVARPRRALRAWVVRRPLALRAWLAAHGWSVVAIGLLGGCLLAEAAVVRTGIDDLDEGYFVQQAARVAVWGQVPYRDFESLYTPGLLYLHAALFWLLGGPNVLGPRLLALLARAALAGLLYALARPLVRQPLLAALPGLVLLGGFDAAPDRWEPHPGWLSSAFAVLATWCLSRRAVTARWLLGSGAAGAAAYVFKQNAGAFIMLAIVLRGLWPLLRAGWPLHRAALRHSLRDVGLPVAAFVACTLVWLGPLLVTLGGHIERLGGFVGALSTAGLFAPPEPTLLIPLACLIGGLLLVRREAGWLLLAGGCLLMTQYPRMDTLHLAWSAPLLLVVGAAALARAPAQVVAASLASVALLAVPVLNSRAGPLRTERVAVAAGVEVPRATARDLQGALDQIAQRTAAGEPIFVYPTSPLLYALAGRPNPTRFDHLNPGAATAAQIQATIADLERSDVRLVVVSDFWRAAWGPPGPNTTLEDWLAQHYTPVATAGSYRVLARI